MAVIRASGAECFSLIDNIFRTRSGKTALELKARSVHYGLVMDGPEIVDDVIFTKFSGDASFTGEDSFEIHCHGNPLIIRRVLELLYHANFRPAKPGEFTRRAYLNGKLDVDAAQAVAEIIEARNNESLKAAQRLKSGSFRREMLQLRSQLMNILADLNAELDFIDEDITFGTREAKLKTLHDVLARVQRLIQDAERFETFKDGVHIAIVGKPNAGKSSLMNRLLGEERAIVSDIAGTTRDYIEAELTLAGYNVRLFDTAGLNENSQDPIEKLGIARTHELIARAHICLNLIDGSGPQRENEAKPGMLTVVNKSDVLHESRNPADAGVIYISVKSGAGMDLLVSRLTQIISERAPTNALPLNLWQRELLGQIAQYLETAAKAITQDELPEVISHTVGLAVEKIAELTGEISSEDILGRIFSRFCIGK